MICTKQVASLLKLRRRYGIAVALALTRFMLNLPYSSWMTTDFDFPNDVAKRDPSFEKKSLAVKPHAPQDSATTGTHTQPKSAHLPVLALSFLSSVALAAAPAVTPASRRVSGLSGEVTDRSRAAGLPMHQ